MHECVLVRDDSGYSTGLYMCHFKGCMFVGDIQQTSAHVVKNQFVVEKPPDVHRDIKLRGAKDPRKYT